MKSGLSAFTTIKVYDVVKYVTLTHEAIIPEVMMVSKVWFNKLPKKTQQILIEEGKAIQPELLKFTLKAQQDARKIWKQHGGELIELSVEDRAKMMKMLSNVAEKVFSGKPQLRGIYELLVKTAAKNR